MAAETVRTTLASVQEAAARVAANIERVIVGKGEVVELALVAVLCQGHLLIEDVPGIGKTTLAKTIARSLGCSFKRIQFTPDLMPADITGLNYYNQKTGEFEFRAGPIIAQVVLADEINRATPRTQAALLEAMEEHQVTIDGETVPLPQPFLVLATQNPIELEGTFPLPEAQLDRFLLRLRLGYPSQAEEEAIIERFEATDPLAATGPVLEAGDVLRLSSALTAVTCEPVVRRYLVQLVQATRESDAFDLGASPRASLALFRTARALAAVRGRDYVLPDDVKYMAPLVIPHRLILGTQAHLRGRDAEGVLREILETIPVPVEE
jgi:MoxR-like ATPase